MSKKCVAFSKSKLGLEKPDNKKAFYAGWDAALAEQAEQEPVAWMDLHKELGKLRWMGGDEGWDNAINAVRDRLIELATLHPVRTKDLTDDEIAQAVGSPLDEVYLADFRAVIAADREKNK